MSDKKVIFSKWILHKCYTSLAAILVVYLSLQYICYHSQDYLIAKYHIQHLDRSIEIVPGFILCG